MKYRSPIAVFIFSMITFGFYGWYWVVKTKGEMNKMGENIPTAWIWLIPIVGTIYWTWKYSEGAGHVTKDKLDAALCFVLLFLLGYVGSAIVQHYFNETVVAQAPEANTQTEAIIDNDNQAPVEQEKQ